VLCNVVLTPGRLRRVAVCARLLESDDHRRRIVVGETIEQLMSGLFGDEQLPAPLARLRSCAADELMDVFDPRVTLPDLPSSLPALVELCTWARHLRIAGEELPVLAESVRADRVEGANPRCHGEVFLAAEAALIDELEQRRDNPVAPGWVSRGERALRAFDRAGIGREPLAEEVASDLFIRTAATTGAVAATVLDSGRSGLTMLRPVTKAARGLALVGYWVASGLTRGGRSARYGALGALALGGLLLVLSVFGLLPSWATAPGALLGAAALFCALAYGAMRSGTVLHGVVLLSPVLPLLVIALARDMPAGQTGTTTVAVTLAASAAIVVGLIVLGSLPTPARTPTAAARALLDREAVRWACEPSIEDRPHWSEHEWAARRRVAAMRTGVRLVTTVGVVAVIGYAATRGAAFWVPSGVPGWIVPVVLGVLNAALLALGWWQARRVAADVRQWDEVADGAGGPFVPAHTSRATAATVGWSVVYGACFSVVAWLAAWLLNTDGVAGPAVTSGCAVAAAVLLVAVPFTLPARDRRDHLRALRRGHARVPVAAHVLAGTVGGASVLVPLGLGEALPWWRWAPLGVAGRGWEAVTG
jgi:hypothetical protein